LSSRRSRKGCGRAFESTLHRGERNLLVPRHHFCLRVARRESDEKRSSESDYRPALQIKPRLIAMPIPKRVKCAQRPDRRSTRG
jgi:hypothetical protein